MILTTLLLVTLMEVIVAVESTKNTALFVNVWNQIMAASSLVNLKNSELQIGQT